MASMPAKRLVPSSPGLFLPQHVGYGFGSRTSRPDIRFSGLFPLTDKRPIPRSLHVVAQARPKSAGVLGSVKDKPLTGAQVRVLDRPCARRPIDKRGPGRRN